MEKDQNNIGEKVDEEKKNFRDVVQVIAEAFSTTGIEPVRDTIISVTGLANPIAGVGLTAIDSVMKQYNDYRLQLLLMGLTAGNNVEKGINQLYNYVVSSPEKAIEVANLLKKTINAESPKVCVMYGTILAEHTADKSYFSQEELILCKALENATDYDLCNFKAIMGKCIVTNALGVRVVRCSAKELEKYEYTCQWAVYNRIFKLEIADFGELSSEDAEYETLAMETGYQITEIADMLVEKIREIQQVFAY